MKQNYSLASIFAVAIFVLLTHTQLIAQAQVHPADPHAGHNHATSAIDSLAGFNEARARTAAADKGLTPFETEKFVQQAKKNYIARTFYGAEAGTRQERITANSAQRLGPINPTPQAPCTNMDFETGNFTGWTGSTGDNTLSSNGPLQNIVPGIQSTVMDALLSDQNARHTIVSAASGNDPCGGFPMVAPGGNYSVRLGGTTANYQGEILEQTFTVAPGNTSFTYQYAVVLNDGGHSAGEQPYFKIEMFDQSGNLVPCSQYYVEASGSIPGFVSCGGGTFYKPWTTVNIDLSSFVTANVTIRFTVAGCIYAGHYGYAYVDCSCLPYAIALSDSLCAGSSVTLSAPPGAQSYNWTLGAPPASSIGTADSLVVSQGGNYYVEMVSVTGCTTYLNVSVGIYPQPTAAFTPQFPPCSPNYTFQNNSTVSSGNMLYYWDFGDPVTGADTSIATSPSYNYTPPGPYTVWLYVTTTNGCSDSVSHVVNPGNGGLASFTAPPVCVGAPTTFADNSINPTAWSWHFGEPSSGPNDSSNVQNPTHTYATAGTYTVSLTAGTSPCPSTYTTTVTVNPLPTASYTYTQVCGGQTVNFTSTSTIAVTDTIGSYLWNFGDVTSGPQNTSALPNPTHTFSGPGTYTVTLVTTSTNGCPASTQQVISVGPSPVAIFSAANVCTNTPMQFTNNSQNSANYLWNFGDPLTLADTSNLVNPSYTYTTAGTYTVVLTAEPSSNCLDTAQLIVTVAPGPAPSFAAPAVCDGNAMNFFDQSTISTGSISQWSWDFGVASSGADTSNVQSPSFQYPIPGTYTVTLTVTSNNGCVSTLTQPVTIHANPTANFTANTVCIGSPTQFTDLSTAGSGNLTVWGWDYGDGSPFGTGQNPTHTYTNDSTYNVTLIVQNSNGCFDTIVLAAVTAPQPVVVFTSDTFAGCPPLCVNFQDQTTIASGSITGWAWNFGDSATSFNQNPTHCYTDPGLYTVTLTTTSNSGCVQTLVFPNMIEVYPEPTASFTATPMVTTVSQTHIDFTDLSLGNPVAWHWDFATGFPQDTSSLQNPGFNYTQEYGANYDVVLTVTNQYGCTDDTTIEIIVQPEFTFYIPNAFTPNGDGVNDVFFGQGIGIAKYEMWIFDRWGNLIFTSTDILQAWDGTVQGAGGDLCQIDTYVWKVAITDVFDKRHKYIGHVSLIR